MQIRKYLPKYPIFYLSSILLTIALIIATLLVTNTQYIWYLDEDIRGHHSNQFFVDNHSSLMTFVFILNGFSLLMPRLMSELKLSLIYVLLTHGLLNGVVVALSLVPIYVIIDAFIEQKISNHFYSTHCWFGVITGSLLCVQFFAAIVFYPFNAKRGPLATNKFQLFHRKCGYTVFGLLCLCCLLGISDINSFYQDKFPEEYDLVILLPNLMAIVITFFALIVYYIVFSRFKLRSELVIIRTKRYNERQKFVARVYEKQQKGSQIA